jgi:hypothetical protein
VRVPAVAAAGAGVVVVDAVVEDGDEYPRIPRKRLER